MSFDILGLLDTTTSGALMRQVSAYFGESEQNTHNAMRIIEAALLAGLMRRASIPAGAQEVFRSVTDSRVDEGIAGKLSGFFANTGNVESVIRTGETQAGSVFGNRAGNVTSAIAESSGVSPDSALALIGMTAPLLFGMLKKYAIQNGLDARGLAETLLKQRRPLQNSALDDGISNALGFGSKAELLSSLPAAAPLVKMRDAQQRGWVPWAVAAGIAVLGTLLFVNRTAERQDTETASVPATTDRMKLAAAPTRVYFEAGEARIDQEDRQRIARAAVSAVNEDRSLAVTGYAHRVGDEDENYELAKDRAYAVRDALVDAGVAEEKIVVDPPALMTESAKEEDVSRVDIDMR